MSRQFRTLWLIGFTCAAAGLSGCETREAARCVDDPQSRFFNVQWEIDNGSANQQLPPLSCAQAPASTVILHTSIGQDLEVGIGCRDDRFYNFSGSTVDGLPVGTSATSADLVRNSDQAVISSSATPTTQIGACAGVALTIQFPLGG